ncbi:MAG: hypothetical protein IT320_23905 [Anaerolineae bacterium]|nr:hypothetical protein [Anaerolineae bacterium]
MNPTRVQIVVGVPHTHLYTLLEAMASAGAGELGEYTHCSYSSDGIGRFKPSAAANPTLGAKETINEVPEVRVETICPRDKVKQVVTAIRAAHPYEEPMIYLLPLLSEDDFS